MGGVSISRRRFVELGMGALGAVSLVGLAGCNVRITAGGEGGVSTSTGDPKGVDLKGVFVVRPGQTEIDAGVDFSAIPDTRSLVLCVFDIENTSEKNWDIPFPDIAISYPSGNAYEPENFDLPSQVQIFVKRCGYVSASNAIELDAGAAPVRCIAAFLVSESDLAGSDPGMFSVGLNDGFGGSFELGAESIKEIALPDGIFEIEEDPDAYQLAMSLPARSNIASNLVSAAVNAFNSGDSDSCLLDLLSAQSFFFEDANWGVSVLMDGFLDTATVLSESLPAFNVEAIARIDEERGADAVTLRDCTTQMYDAFLQGDYATVNTAKDQAYTVFLKYQQL